MQPALHAIPPLCGEDNLPALEECDFLRLAHLAHRCFGLDLREGKQGFVEARLGRLVRELGLASFQQYCDYLAADRTGAALANFANRLTTNHTSFFREAEHFDFLCSTVLPSLRARRHIEIWSAGCSSGEEPYSIALAVLGAAPRIAARTSIHATDLSTRMLDRATAAVYSAGRMEPIPASLRARYIIPAAAPNTFRIGPAARSLVSFARHNLVDPFPALRFSFIFCRNVMFYFDRSTHEALVQRFSAHLEPGGYLFIGHSESLNGFDHALEAAAPAVYRKPLRERETALKPGAASRSAAMLSAHKKEVSA